MRFQYRVDFNFDKFQWWSGARERIESATDYQLAKLKDYIETMYSYDEYTPTDGELNDLVWFECDWIFNVTVEDMADDHEDGDFVIKHVDYGYWSAEESAWVDDTSKATRYDDELFAEQEWDAVVEEDRKKRR